MIVLYMSNTQSKITKHRKCDWKNTEKQSTKYKIIVDTKGIQIIELSARDFKIEIKTCLRKESGIDTFGIVMEII